MTTFLTILFVIFLVALLVLGIALYRIYSFLRSTARRFGIGKGKHQSFRDFRSAQRRENRSTARRRGRIIPPEYAVDAEYTVMQRTGTEEFVAVREVLSLRGEGQMSEARYTIIDP